MLVVISIGPRVARGPPTLDLLISGAILLAERAALYHGC